MERLGGGYWFMWSCSVGFWVRINVFIWILGRKCLCLVIYFEVNLDGLDGWYFEVKVKGSLYVGWVRCVEESVLGYRLVFGDIVLVFYCGVFFVLFYVW